MKIKSYSAVIGIAMAVALAGCTSLCPTNEPAGFIEPDWIRSGESVTYEGESWYPSDNVEILLDSEVYLIGEYHGAQVFVEKTDVRPYERLYTRFDKNKFRSFEKKSSP